MVMTEPESARSEEEILFSLVRERYASRLTPAELEAIRTGLTGIIEGVRALRAVRLDNADGPILPRLPDAPPRP
jgi:hypothetical protein